MRAPADDDPTHTESPRGNTRTEDTGSPRGNTTTHDPTHDRPGRPDATHTESPRAVSYTHLRAHETRRHL
eukprot:5298223-Prorocentrum_lima.AAC.1